MIARHLLALALAIGIASFTAGCASGKPDPPGYLRVAIANAPANLDPRVGLDEASQRVHQLVFGSLFQLDDRLQVVPEIALGWETPDDRTYIVRVRQGVRFHDGRELTAADVVYTFRSFLDPAFTSGRKGAYRLLAAVDVVDSHTVRFTLKEPFGSFPVNLVMPIVQDGATEVARRPIGTGPYRFVRAVADDRVVLERFDGYFNGPARNPGVVLRVVPDDTMRGLEVRKGSIDLVVNDLSPDIVRALERGTEVNVRSAPGCDYAYVGLNLRDPVLADVRVRQALAHAINRNAIVEHLRRGLATEAVGIMPPVSWAFNPEVPDFPYDPAKARALLDAAGYRDPDGDGPQPRLRMVLKTSIVEFARLQATVIQQDLHRVGVDVEIRSYEFATFLGDVIRGNFQMCTLQWVGVSDPDMLRRVFHSTQTPPAGWNRGFFSDPEVDALIEAATRSLDPGERQRLFGEVQTRVASAVPQISLWHKTNVAIAQPGVSGIRLTPLGDFGFLRGVARDQAGGGRDFSPAWP